MITILSTLAVQGALPGLVRRYEAGTGDRVEIRFGPTNGLLARIAAGETADIAIVTRAAMDDLAAQDVIAPDSIADLAVSRVGIAVKQGAARPDISTADALVAALRAARSIAYSKIGASGVFFAGLIRRLGIAEEVNAKAIITPGLTGKLVARGEAELAVQQLSELRLVSGIDIVGPLPPGAESITTFSAGVFRTSAQAAAARQLIDALRSPEAGDAFTAAGLERPA